MAFLSDLGNFGGGFAQGLQGSMQAASQLRLQAAQLQDAQFALDQKKKEIAAQAAALGGLPGGQQGQPGAPVQGAMTAPMAPPSGPQPQPPMPGQASVPNQPPQPMTPPPGAQAAPQAAPMPQQGQPQQPGGNGLQGQDLSPQAQMTIIGQIAAAIKQQNPGIDPQTLFMAVKDQIGLMGALSNTQKQQLVLATDQVRAQIAQGHDQTSARNADVRTAASRDIAAGHDTTSARNTDVRASAMIQATQARITDADNRLNQTQAAIDARQDKSLQGRATKTAQTERLAMLRTRLSQAKQKLSAAAAQGQDTTQAQKAVDDAYAGVLDFQGKVMKDQAAPAGGAPGGGGGQFVEGQTYTDANGNKAIYRGGRFVAVP